MIARRPGQLIASPPTRHFIDGSLFRSLLIVVFLLGCGSSDGGKAAGQGGGGASTGDGGGGGASTGDGGGGGASGGEDIELTEADFDCLLSWNQVRRFRITNKLGNIDDSLQVANEPGSADYPVGTLIQLIPAEAMVKRKRGFSADSNDWEFFFLDVSAAGTTIRARGTTDVVNGFGGNCLNCHVKAERQYDYVCETGHGCDPLPVTAEQIEMAQQADPRCPSGN
jgi:hypothetical protein